jgi:hypothetical protein
MQGCPGVALDTHVYQAWFDIRSQESFLDNACSWKQRIRDVQETTTLPLLIGEWSLATDNCQMWLNGFHDNAPGYPKVSRSTLACKACVRAASSRCQGAMPVQARLSLTKSSCRVLSSAGRLRVHAMPRAVCEQCARGFERPERTHAIWNRLQCPTRWQLPNQQTVG